MVGCVAVTLAVSSQLGGARLIADLLIVLAFPLLLVATGAVRRHEARAVLADPPEPPRKSVAPPRGDRER